jgi:hypothetical protein
VQSDPIKARVITSKGEQYSGGAASTMFWLGPEKEMWGLTQLLPSSTIPIRRELRTIVYQAIVE